MHNIFCSNIEAKHDLSLIYALQHTQILYHNGVKCVNKMQDALEIALNSLKHQCVIVQDSATPGYIYCILQIHVLRFIEVNYSIISAPESLLLLLPPSQ